MNNVQQDPSQPIEPFLKKLLSLLDLQLHLPGTASPQPQFPSVEAYATQFAKQLKPASAVVFNGNPLIPQAPANDSRLEFQKKWLASPASNHQLTCFDTHLVPGTGLYTIIAHGKVRFDESGRTRLGESADLVVPSSGAAQKPRALWGPWFGFNINLVVDQSVATNDETECINSLNYRVTYKPHDTVVSV
ncbi:NTF2-like protein [Metschnikowia bicuspidata var. bicuspidata NRRL YB-4993]|uniref:NTF2-like protein n=1 Tax=Metschnikowia bicuspidata var. bicuspidata NRRL YB-4993 TaxID=869754 RepID=A0A1A0HFB5_9ASCO|nr:NTF2-like protein [Metschnikowia bicuspidata var. bicuspidata NRRL YB-4993]OBA22587.1 NTF2-like protein [Metschnikowia bicuspidata var. bicuspidata NRRL YB-4993]